MINVAVMGYGTVGSGVVEVLRTNGELINERAQDVINVKYVLDLRDFPGDQVEEILIHDFETIVNDAEVDIVVETMGGVEPAYTFVKRCLEAGKNVATSNKALVAKHGAELLEIARDRSINFMFEASVGGGIPIIRALNSSLTADRIDEVTGILNGTTNYMLTKMFFESADYDEVLKEAQEKGYAERNPEADVEGHDACRKIAILTSLIAGQHVDFETIHTEGITKITTEDMKYAKTMDMAIKLLASSKREGESFSAIVAPMLLSKNHPLCNVNDVFNAIFVRGNMLGDAMFYGSGAGKLPTASAVVADVVDAAKHLHRTVVTRWESNTLELVPNADAKRRFFVRIHGEESVLKSRVDEVFGQVEFVKADDVEGEFAVITGEMTEAEYAQKAEEMPEVLAQTNYDQKKWETEKSWLVSDSMKLNSAESGEAVIDTDWEKAGISAENFDDVMGITSTNMGKRYVTAPFEKAVTVQGTVCLKMRAALKDGDAECDFHPENRNDADTLTMKLGNSKISGKMDDVEVAVLLCDVCDEEFDSIQTVDPERNIVPVEVVKEGGIVNGGDLPAFDEAEFKTVHKKYRVITRAFADLCNPEAGYEPETAQNSIELKKGEYHDYNIYLNATRYTVQPGHSLAIVIATEDPVNCLIHKTYSVAIDNASVKAEVPVTKAAEDRTLTLK